MSLIVLLLFFRGFPDRVGDVFFRAIFTAVFILFVVKMIWGILLFIDDFIRSFQWLISLFSSPEAESIDGISRKNFLVKTGALLGAGMGAALTYGVTVGSHHYKVTRQKLKVRGYSKDLNGFRIVQISDIHSGSFWNKRAVQKGIDLIKDQKADVVFFTGDMVNNESKEFEPYEAMFKEIQAPKGVYAILGNHDYADYMPNLTQEERHQNVIDLENAYKRMGWKLLRNENKEIHVGSDSLNVIGIDNWSAIMRFPKYGDLYKAMEGVDRSKLNLLLSHDPTHWKGQVLKEFKDIDVTFSGHTHGMQFGIETAGFKWSPVQYIYDQWAGLYEDGDQKLYVNRGFGYLGYPGRLGIRPEITVFEIEVV